MRNFVRSFFSFVTVTISVKISSFLFTNGRKYFTGCIIVNYQLKNEKEKGRLKFDKKNSTPEKFQSKTKNSSPMMTEKKPTFTYTYANTRTHAQRVTDS